MFTGEAKRRVEEEWVTTQEWVTREEWKKSGSPLKSGSLTSRVKSESPFR